MLWDNFTFTSVICFGLVSYTCNESLQLFLSLSVVLYAGSHNFKHVIIVYRFLPVFLQVIHEFHIAHSEKTVTGCPITVSGSISCALRHYLEIGF